MWNEVRSMESFKVRSETENRDLAKCDPFYMVYNILETRLEWTKEARIDGTNLKL